MYNYTNTMSLNTIKQISKEIDDLEEEKDLNQKIKKYDDIKKNIKDCYSLLKSLSKKISATDIDNSSNIDESKYSSYMSDISDEKIEEIMECDDLEKQIKSYLEVLKKIEQCKKHLTSKKMKIINV